METLKCILILLFFIVNAKAQIVFPLAKSANGRYLQDQNGIPFQIRGDGCWGIATGLDTVQMRTFLLNRKAKGFNTVLFEVVNHFYTANAPNNAYNVAPFTNLNDFTTISEDYWKVVDVFFRLADSLHILLIPIPAYFGYPGTEEGWDTEISASGNIKMKTYGRFLGGRYKNYANVIWLMGGDRNPSEAEMVTIDSIRNGIRDSTTTQWFSLDTDSPTSAADAMRGRTWLDINQTYCYDPSRGEPYVWDASRVDYARSPVQTFFLKESYAEQIHIGAGWTTTNDQTVRSANYWNILSGSCGAIYMNEQEVYWESAYWVGAMESDGSIQSGYCWSLFKSRYWWKLIPDRDSTVMTAGSLSGTSFATTAYASDSSSVIAYLPTQRVVTIAPAKLKGDSIHVWWYNPSNSAVTEVGMYSKVSRSYNPPNAGDWVLVIDGKNLNFNQPGNVAPRLVSPANSSTGQLLNPFLVWNASEEVESYSVHVALDPGFGSTVLLDTLIVDTTRQVVGLANATTYYWRVRSVNQQGQTPWSNTWSFRTILDDVSTTRNLPLEFRLRQNYPNPFNPVTMITYDLPRRSSVTLTVFNILGQEVRTLVHADQEAGSYVLSWDGKDDLGQALSSGIYLCRLNAGTDVANRKMLLLK